ncbi:hypothetical protein [Conexibacter sp. SYSU D00693]|uniref:hypothetical protein n=1 Tax=Conexibacter sp. SYSU D00693 TaxID=2812560 RepID=UPI00196A52A0|nr:hypothetical protein [Conexibacter sp. SYSU D00693]
MRRTRLEQLLFLALLAGVAVFLVVAAASDPEGSDVPASTVASSTTATTTTATPQTTQAPATPLRSGTLTATLGGIQVVPATSASGRQRQRVRVVVGVRVTNSAESSVAIRDVFRLAYSGRSVAPDRGASGEIRALDLNRALEEREEREGELRFELAGEDTAALRRSGRARIEFTAPRGRSAAARVTVAFPR